MLFSNLCPCESGKDFSTCCEPYTSLLHKVERLDETVLLSWINRYSLPIQDSFKKKASTIVFRISIYADIVFESLYLLGFRLFRHDQENLDESFRAAKHNIMLSLFASLSCLSQGLFLQSGSLIRCCIEDSLVLLDLSEHDSQLIKFLSGNYLANNVLKRVKQFIPKNFLRWYGHYSANFIHFGPFHTAPYIPRACYPDNYVLGSGLENLLLAMYMIHVVLERAHFNQLQKPFFWISHNKSYPEFQENNIITQYVHNLQKEIYLKFHPDKREKGYSYTSKTYRAK